MEAKSNGHQAFSAIAAAVLLAALVLFFHGSALKGGWRIDDPWILLYVIEHPAAPGYFFSPEQWRSLSATVFTPWLVLDYWLDLALFGLNPSAFYAHHLLSVWLAALLTFLLLCRHISPLWGIVAATLFIVGAPVAVVSQQLMSRHYAAGLVFAILAIVFWLRTREAGSQTSLALATGCYLIAMLNKEVFAPLPLALLFLGSGPLKARFRAIVPFLLTAVLFVTWRAVMVGRVIGGYGGGFHAVGDIPGSLAALPAVFFGTGWPSLAGGLILLLAAIFLIRSFKQTLPLLLAAAVALALPFMAIHISTNVVDLRFAFLPWWGTCVLLSFGLQRLVAAPIAGTEFKSRHVGTRRAVAILATLTFFGVTLAKSLATSRAYDTVAAEFDVQGRFLWDHDETAGYIPFGEVAAALQFPFAISALKRSLLGQGIPIPAPFMESALLLTGNAPVHAYDPDCRCMKRADEAMEALTQNKTYQPTLPLEILLDRSKAGLVWRVKAPADASCYLVFPGANAAVTIPCSGEIFYPPPPLVRGSFRFIVRTADGLWKVSPSLVFPEEGQRLKWSRDPLDPETAGSNIP